MSLIKKSVSGFAGVVACLGLAALTANAQQAQFTLPVEAHWGKAVLEPGKYTVSFPNGVDATPVLRVTGNGKTVSTLLQSRTEGRGDAESGKLILENIDGAYVVKSISNPVTQVSFRFATPKVHEASVTTANAHQPASVAVEIKKVGQ